MTTNHEKTIKVEKQVHLPTVQTWQLVADVEAQQHWLGPGAFVKPVKGARVQLNHEAGPWRGGTVTAIGPGEKIECELAPASSWIGFQEPTCLTISIEDHPRGGSQVTVEESGLLLQSDVQAFWEAALARLSQLAVDINRRRGKPRQAVVVIHGIGEQEPGVTLRKFVSGALLAGNSELQAWVKPDFASRIFDLRRVQIGASKHQRRPTTDVFELYWAYMIHDTTLSQVGSWLRQLLFREGAPKHFSPLRFLAWVAILGSILVLACAARFWPQWMGLVLILSVLALALWRFLGKSLALNILGDAARYLSPRPDNIEQRQAIREAGVELLGALHAQGSFDRIVIVGHSLGSVIAYDIITYYWIRVHREHLRLPKVDNTGITSVEKSLDENNPKKIQKLQHEAWRKLRLNSQPWLITDLVTLGSPLSAASFLMAKNAHGFQRAKHDRELPSCPPVEERKERKTGKRRISFTLPYEDRFGGRDKTIMQLHHAAPFAVTRWTNLHFKRSLVKDPVGGPVAREFGHWIHDIKLGDPEGQRCGLHTWYWRRKKANKKNLRKLRKALRLNVGSELLADLRRQSPLMYLPKKNHRPHG